MGRAGEDDHIWDGHGQPIGESPQACHTRWNNNTAMEACYPGHGTNHSMSNQLT